MKWKITFGRADLVIMKLLSQNDYLGQQAAEE